MIEEKSVFVTVGTTTFDKLVSSVLEEDFLKTLSQLGYRKLKIQTGTGPNVKSLPGPNMEILCLRYVEDFGHELDEADLIISHAGAGTCLEILQRGRPAIVVINEDLMDNHQVELAHQLQEDGYVYYCTCRDLQTCVKKDINALKKYPTPDKRTFAKYLDRCVGFS